MKASNAKMCYFFMNGFHFNIGIFMDSEVPNDFTSHGQLNISTSHFCDSVDYVQLPSRKRQLLCYSTTRWTSSCCFFLNVYYPLANEVAKGYSNATVRPSFRPSVRPSHPCEHSRINILQWILTKLGTYLVLKRIWNPIVFQGQRSRSPGQFFYRITLLWTLWNQHSSMDFD